MNAKRVSADVLPLNRVPRPLISDSYRAQQEQLHKRADYGVASVEFAPFVMAYLVSNRISELLDYGCGKARLAAVLGERFGSNVVVHNYDPAIPEFSQPPQPCDTVVCIDVLEHIEPELLDNVLDNLARLAKKHFVCTVHTGPAAKVLSDGRNAHLIQKPADWWLEALMERFMLVEFRMLRSGFWSVWGAR